MQKLNDLASEFYEIARHALREDGEVDVLKESLEECDIYPMHHGIHLSCWGETIAKYSWKKLFESADIGALDPNISDIEEVLYFLKEYEKDIARASSVLQKLKAKAEKYKAAETDLPDAGQKR